MVALLVAVLRYPPADAAEAEHFDTMVSTQPTQTAADYLIIGAGVIGSSIAFRLAERQAGRIVVVDKGFVGQGNSARSSAMVRMHYTYAPEVQLVVSSLEVFQNWEEIVGRPPHYTRVGFFRIVPNKEMEHLRANVAMQRQHGANVQLVSAADVQEIEPDWRVDDFDEAAYEPDSGYGDGAAVALDFLDRAQELGVDYRSQTQVLDLELEGNRVGAVRTDHGRIAAGTIVLATGPWSPPLLASIGTELPIKPEFHKVVYLKNAEDMKSRGAACIDSITNTYFRSEGPAMTLVGDFYGPYVDPDSFPENADDDEIVATVSAATQRIPRLQEAGIARLVTGVYDVTPDARPMLGPVPGVRGLHCAIGFSGMGFKISPAIGMVMSEQLLDGQTTSIDISGFRPQRFAEGCPIEPLHAYQDD